jgi:hypothetical protein
MELIENRKWLRTAAMIAAAIGMLLSLLTLYLKLYFWGGMAYAPVPVWLASWFLIAAGPLALWQSWKRPLTAMAIVALQVGLIGLASVDF